MSEVYIGSPGSGRHLPTLLIDMADGRRYELGIEHSMVSTGMSRAAERDRDAMVNAIYRQVHG